MSKRYKTASSDEGKRKQKSLNPEKKARKGDQASKRQINFANEDNEPSASTSVKEIREKMANDANESSRNLSVIK